MTKSILLSDVELVKQLVNVNCQDEEIIEVLCRRGLEGVKASQLVHDIRCGLHVKPELVVMPCISSRRRSKHPREPIRAGWPFTLRESTAMLLMLVLFLSAGVYFFYSVAPQWGMPHQEESPKVWDGKLDPTNTIKNLPKH
jgi:hypothetical protein